MDCVSAVSSLDICQGCVRLTVEICGRFHPTPFHRVFKRQERKEGGGGGNRDSNNDSGQLMQGGSATCFMTGQSEEQISFLIVPVWLSYKEDPSHKIRPLFGRKHFVSLAYEAIRLSICSPLCMERTQPFQVRRWMFCSFMIISVKWQLPYLAHYHAKKPDKIHVVFDSSADYKRESLNKYLLTGPDLTNGLVGVLCQFRRDPVAFMCDLEAMFHQFKVDKRHRNLLWFLWWPDGDIKAVLVEYRMTVHLLGAGSSPGCANFALKRIATDHEEEFGHNGANFVRDNFYVDNDLKLVPTVTETIKLIESTLGLRPHKFTSNSRKS